MTQYLAIGHKQADERQPDVALRARDEHLRRELLIRLRRFGRSRQNHASAAVIVGDQHGVADAELLAGRAAAPPRRRDCPRVHRLQRRLEQIDALEKKRPLLREQEREALVRRDLRGISLDLREVGVEREIDCVVRVRQPFQVEPDFRVDSIRDEP